MFWQVVGAVTASIITAAFIGIWRAITKFGRRAEKALVLVEEQLAPNGGNSLKDQIATLATKLDARHAENVSRLGAIEKRLGEPWDGRERRRPPWGPWWPAG